MALENGYSAGLQTNLTENGDVDLEVERNSSYDNIAESKDVSEGVFVKDKWHRCRGGLIKLPIMLTWLTIGIIIGAAFTQAPATSKQTQEAECDEHMEHSYELEMCFEHDDGPVLATKVKFSGVNFLVVGDWGRNGHCCQRDVAHEMAKTSKALMTNFTISTGDNFYSKGITDKDSEQIDSSWARVYDKEDLLDKPWYGVLGNHDYKGDPLAQLGIDPIKYPAWKIRTLSYSKTFSDDQGELVDIVFIDTSPLLKEYYDDDEMNIQATSNSVEQAREKIISFLNEELNNSKGVWKIVVGHHPIFTVGEHFGEDGDHFLENTLAPIFEEHNVSVYFSGHDHNLQHITKKNVNYIVSGAGSKIRPKAENKYNATKDEPIPRFHAGHQGFASVSISRSELMIQFLDLRGTWLYTKIIEMRE
uniref:Calcineurin-like phosphoesterase domain-containing protein n=1 Tax=Aplanochytrium stocchinoi TaxID=215587 RepID=A0A7S3LSH2_9STRA|mmetsp:Transcript_11692/g.13513  ORF Transcript_11692/g.13513 Transcript_11692/m.13513 type:complete len:418 (+) Transcript_11692:196-1449(+)